MRESKKSEGGLSKPPPPPDRIGLMQSLRETKESIAVLMNIAEECGMNINKAKSNIMIFNHKEKIHEDNIEGFF